MEMEQDRTSSDDSDVVPVYVNGKVEESDDESVDNEDFEEENLKGKFKVYKYTDPPTKHVIFGSEAAARFRSTKEANVKVVPFARVFSDTKESRVYPLSPPPSPRLVKQEEREKAHALRDEKDRLKLQAALEAKKKIQSKPIKIYNDPFVNCKVRKYFPTFGWYEGIVLHRTYLKDSNRELYRILYDDGDSEDIGVSDLRKILIEDPEASAVDPAKLTKLSIPDIPYREFDV